MIDVDAIYPNKMHRFLVRFMKWSGNSDSEPTGQRGSHKKESEKHHGNYIN